MLVNNNGNKERNNKKENLLEREAPHKTLDIGGCYRNKIKFGEDKELDYQKSAENSDRKVLLMENDDINIEKEPGHKKRLETENVPIESEEIDDKTKTDEIAIIKNEKEFWVKMKLEHWKLAEPSDAAEKCKVRNYNVIGEKKNETDENKVKKDECEIVDQKLADGNDEGRKEKTEIC
ncbi:hypothetical protein C2G38_2212020 [Gigaspora rosea]|uniref:Uncharacterized protein n=1 Tax=Gigaspora rosea TaxID=44941 RepID=A0A397UGF1_9GLOM|nr:hypothetical protein C2G38_2212020 [Gigaspora rosea]